MHSGMNGRVINFTQERDILIKIIGSNAAEEWFDQRYLTHPSKLNLI